MTGYGNMHESNLTCICLIINVVFPISSVSIKGCNGSTGRVYSGLGLLIDDMVPAGAGVMQLFLKC